MKLDEGQLSSVIQAICDLTHTKLSEKAENYLSSNDELRGMMMALYVVGVTNIPLGDIFAAIDKNCAMYNIHCKGEQVCELEESV